MNIRQRRELFVDRELIEELRGVRLELARPVDAGPALVLDRPWEGAFSAYTTALQDGSLFRLYYRGVPASGQDGNPEEVTCCAESKDGISWRRPELDFYTVRGAQVNNVILAASAPYSHNFSPFVDRRPGVPPGERYKALAGVHKTGLRAFISADGLKWKALREEPVLPPPKEFALDSQNISFWSEAEQKYLLYFRTWKKIGGQNYRWVSRATSENFVDWSAPEQMTYGDAPPEHLYTNQTSPYFRAPHIYVGICARFMPGRQVLNAEQAAAVGVDPKYFRDCSDAVLVTSRGGNQYRREFMEAFLRPGVGYENWVSRSNYPALNLVQTGASTMAFYVNRNYGQPTAYLRRYELRLDGLASARAGYAGGEIVTRPLAFEGSRLELNYSTSAPGSVRVEIQDAGGQPVPGYSAGEGRELIGDEVERVYSWSGGESVHALRGRAVRLRFLLRDADLFAFRFRD
ncbi:MAG: hypothetical protein HY821_06225 [Acidobacteria bacterium]|nr:hypothetical protein [Acidobacteriota bacterium]